MQSVSKLWENLLAADAAREVRFTINGVTYGHDRIVSARKIRSGMQTLSIGEACAASLELSFFPQGYIPPAAEILCEVRLRENVKDIYLKDEHGNLVATDDGYLIAARYSRKSEWIPHGKFYIDTRKLDKVTNLMTVTAYDKMLFAEAPYIDQNGTYPMPAKDAVAFVAAELGVEVDPRNQIYAGKVDSPTNVYNMREVLRFIAAASGGNFIISDEGKLRLVPIASPADNAPVQRCSKLLSIGDTVTITGVRLLPDEDTEYFAGSSDGYVISGECAFATQAICNTVLNKLQGVPYRPLETRGALLNPALEIGDSVNLGGVATVLVHDDVILGAAMVSDVSAPLEEELEHEIPYQSRSREQRMTATSFSEIRKSTSAIALEVKGKLGEEEANSLIQTNLAGITLSASAGNNQSTIKILANGIEVDSAVVKFSKITADSVDAEDISGSLTSDQIDLYGDLTVFEDENLDSSGGKMGYTSKSKDGTGGIHMLNSGNEVRVTSSGAALDCGDNRVVVNASTGIVTIGGEDAVYFEIGGTDAANFTLNDNFYPGAWQRSYLGISGNPWEAVYAETDAILTSDERKKTDIVRDLSAYREFFMKLLPACGKYVNGTSGRTHLYFIAQDVEKAMTECGLTDLDFAGLIKSPVLDEDGNVVDYAYGLRYAEFIPLILDAVQWQHSRMQNQENRLDDQEKRLQAVEQALGLR